MDLVDLLVLLSAALIVTAAAFVSTPLAFLAGGLACGAVAGLLIWGTE